MRSVLSIVAAMVAALCCGSGIAYGQTAADGEQVPHFLFYSGTDLWRYGAFAHGGVLWSPDGIDREGFTLKLLLAGGKYRYRSGATDMTGRQLLAAVLPGWRFKHDRFETTIYLGLDVQNHRFSPDDLANSLRGTHFGAHFAADAWFEPTTDTMVAGAFSLSTIKSSYWGRAQLGVRIPDIGWVGPEVHVFNDLGYQQYSAGLHLTAFKTSVFEWSFGTGYVRDTDGRFGPYGRLGLNVRQ
jgi:hypothetical protein